MADALQFKHSIPLTFPLHSHVSGTEFYHWLGLSALLQIDALRQEMKQHRRFSVLGAARRTKTNGEYTLHSICQDSFLNFFFCLTCIAKTLQAETLWLFTSRNYHGRHHFLNFFLLPLFLTSLMPTSTFVNSLLDFISWSIDVLLETQASKMWLKYKVI